MLETEVFFYLLKTKYQCYERYQWLSKSIAGIFAFVYPLFLWRGGGGGGMS